MSSIAKCLRCPQWILWFGAAALLCGAWFIQYGLKVIPCELCMLQRWPYYIILVVIPALHLLKTKRMIQLLLITAICMVSVGLGIFHSGVELHIWEGLSSCSAAKTPLNSLDLLSELENASIPRCDAVYFTILGHSLANWNAFISAIATAYAAWNLRIRP